MLGWRLIRVTGHSMLPHIPANSYALFRRRRHYHRGDIVLVAHPRFGRVVKQITEIVGTEIRLRGTGSASVSEAALGLVGLDCVLGRMVWLIKPPSTAAIADR